MEIVIDFNNRQSWFWSTSGRVSDFVLVCFLRIMAIVALVCLVVFVVAAFLCSN